MNPEELAKRDELKLSKPHVYDKVVQHGMGIVRIEPSYICNMACQHCSIRDLQKRRGGRSMTIEDIQSIADQADELGLAQFVISGGEPLMYPDFDEIVAAIDPKRFWITTDSNGWLLDYAKAKHLKEIGVDKVQISIDNIAGEVHDSFRGKDGAWTKALAAIRYSKEVGLRVIVQTTVSKYRARNNELIRFIHAFNVNDVPVYIGYMKPVGAWKEHEELDQSDIDYVESLTKVHNVFTHLTPSYDYPGGCIAMKRMINITKWGEVNPCPFMQELVIGNVFDEPLKDIVDRGMKYFDCKIGTCLMATEKDFINEFRKTYTG